MSVCHTYLKLLQWHAIHNCFEPQPMGKVTRCRRRGRLQHGDSTAGNRKCLKDLLWTTLADCHSWYYYYSFQPPLLKDPPETPLPDPTVDSEWYGEIWIRYKPSPTVSPVHLGCVVKANFDLRIILNDIAFQLFQKPEHQATVRQAIEFRARLDDWFKHLPDPLTPRKIVLPDHIKIQ